MSRQGHLFEGARLQMTESIELTVASLEAHAAAFLHWAIAWSGGKDSSTLVTLVIWLILTGRVRAPRTLTVLYADTRLELLPLFFAAQSIREELDEQREALAARDLGLRAVLVEAQAAYLPLIERRVWGHARQATIFDAMGAAHSPEDV